MQITTILVLSHVVDKNYQILITRRAVAERAENIGIWFKILEMLAQLAVISNVRHFYRIAFNFLEPGFPDRLHVGLHPEACLQVWVRGEGGDEGLRHVHPLKVARQKLDFQGPSESKKNHSQKLDCQAKTPLKLHSQKPNMVFGTFTFLQILFSNSTLQSFSKWKIKLPC